MQENICRNSGPVTVGASYRVAKCFMPSVSHDSIGVNITAFRAGNSLLAEHYFYCFYFKFYIIDIMHAIDFVT